jgi:two-component system LytT family response regulator
MLMKKIRTVIIDDESSGRLMLQALIEKYFGDQLDVCAMADSVSEGVDAIHQYAPELLFLDIEMPRESGFELFQKIDRLTFDVIFVTAFSEYAIKAFKVNALDYILKPIDIGEWRAATEKAIKKIQGGNPELAAQTLFDKLKGVSALPQKIGLPMKEGLLFIAVENVVRCESESNYTNVYLEDGKSHLICRTLKEVQETLTGFNFFRVHRSHLINMDKIAMYLRNDGGAVVMSDQSRIPVSRTEKDDFEKRLSSF